MRHWRQVYTKNSAISLSLPAPYARTGRRTCPQGYGWHLQNEDRARDPAVPCDGSRAPLALANGAPGTHQMFWELPQVQAVPGLRSGSVVADTQTNGRRKHSPACVQEMTCAGAGRRRPRRALYAMPQRCGDRRSSVLSGCLLPPTARSNVYRSPGQSIALFNVDGTFYDIHDTCSHRGGLLGEGELHGAIVTCPWHGATFDVQTGAVTGPRPARVSLAFASASTETTC